MWEETHWRSWEHTCNAQIGWDMWKRLHIVVYKNTGLLFVTGHAGRQAPGALVQRCKKICYRKRGMWYYMAFTPADILLMHLPLMKWITSTKCVKHICMHSLTPTCPRWFRCGLLLDHILLSCDSVDLMTAMFHAVITALMYVFLLICMYHCYMSCHYLLLSK